MSKVYKKFQDLEVISIEEIRKEFPKINHRAVIKYLLKKGYWKVLKKGLYQNTAFHDVNKFILGSKLFKNGVISYHSALEVHGLAQSVFNTVHILIANIQNVEQSVINGITYQPVKNTITKGVIKVPIGQNQVLCIDQERTIIDCIDKLKYVGGLEEYFKSISSISYINEKRVIDYLDAYDKAALYHKVGFVLDHFKNQWKISEYTLRSIENGISKKKAVFLEPKSKKVVFVKKWNLLIPKNFASLIGE